MDIQCPACKKIYPEIDFSLAGRKFGCECGHKFFLEGSDGKSPEDNAELGDTIDDKTTLTALSSPEEAPDEHPVESSGDDPAPPHEASKEHPAGATALIEVTCPECEKVYSDIDASLAGSKFGCECGHKFFLEARKKDRPIPARRESKDRAGLIEPLDTPDDPLREERPPLRPRQADPLVLRDLEKKDAPADHDGESPGKKPELQEINPPPAKRKVSRAGNFIVSWLLNIILIGLLISMVYFGFQAMTGRLELPFEIRLQFKDEGGK